MERITLFVLTTVPLRVEEEKSDWEKCTGEAQSEKAKDIILQ